MQKLTTYLMFVGKQHGKAEEAINFYVSLFKDSAVLRLERYGAEDIEPEGTVKHARFTLAGQEFMAMDSNQAHAFTFTPAVSLFVNCESQAEIDELYAKLSEGGGALMPIDNYGFSKRFGWVADRFGVSWQVNLA